MSDIYDVALPVVRGTQRGWGKRVLGLLRAS